MARNVSAKKPVVVDTNIILNGALNPGSDAARMPELVGKFTFWVAPTSILEIDAMLVKFAPDAQLRKAVNSLISGYLAQLAALTTDDKITREPNFEEVSNDQLIGKAADAIEARVCTYNLKHFANATTPAKLLREAEFFHRAFELPHNQIEGTIMYLLRVHGIDRRLGNLIRFKDGTEIEGIKGQRLQIRKGSAVLATSTNTIPENRLSALIIRFKRNEKIIVDIWHPDGSSAIPDKVWRIGSSGRMKMVEVEAGVELWLDKFGHPGNCEFFGSSFAPISLSDTQVAAGVEVESLDASHHSEDIRQLLKNVSFGLRDDMFIASVTGATRRTTHLAAPPWSGFET